MFPDSNRTCCALLAKHTCVAQPPPPAVRIVLHPECNEGPYNLSERLVVVDHRVVT